MTADASSCFMVTQPSAPSLQWTRCISLLEVNFRVEFHFSIPERSRLMPSYATIPGELTYECTGIRLSVGRACESDCISKNL